MSKSVRYILIVVLAFWISSYYYGFIPQFFRSINLKQVLAVVGVGLMCWEVIRTRQYQLSKDLLISAGISIAYSMFNWMSIEANGTYDYTYANYFTSYFTWTFSAYTCMYAMRLLHGRATITLLTCYLAGISAAQCIIALLMDNFEPVATVVNSVSYVAVDFFDSAGRLYGFGLFMLDTAGFRMALTLVLIAWTLSTDREIATSTRSVFWLLLCYGIIVGIGNIVSRSTTVGVAVSTLALLFGGLTLPSTEKVGSSKVLPMFLGILVVLVPLFVYLYQTDEYFYSQFRYGFEGFFNLVEQGEFRTTSSDRLLYYMESWPSTLEEWIIGTGRYRYDLTDAGYELLITYTGLLGFGIFLLMFVYLVATFSRQYPRHTLLFILLFVVGLIMWRKVATDAYPIFALLLFLNKEPAYNPNRTHLIQ